MSRVVGKVNSPATPSTSADPAAIFACAYSLWEACQKATGVGLRVNLSKAYNGIDQLMREVMRIGALFEGWACEHVAFDEWDEVWPYFLGDQFGEAVIALGHLQCLSSLNESDCLRVAVSLNIPAYCTDTGQIPIDVITPNTVTHSAFRQYRIQTVRRHLEDGFIEAYHAESEMDEDFDEPFIALYGIDAEEHTEHVRDFNSYRAATTFAQKIAHGIFFLTSPFQEERVSIWVIVRATFCGEQDAVR